LVFFQGELDRARDNFAASEAICRALGDRAGTGAALDGLADIAYVERDYARARALQGENLALREAVGDRWGAAMATMGLGLIALGAGDRPRARALLEEGLARCRAVGDPRGIATMLLLLGWVAVGEAEAERVIAILLESLALFRAAGNAVGVAECLEGLACAAGLRAAPLLAARLAGAAGAQREAILVSVSPNVGLYERHLAVARAQIPAEAWEAAHEVGRRLDQDGAIALARTLSAGEAGVA